MHFPFSELLTKTMQDSHLILGNNVIVLPVMAAA